MFFFFRFGVPWLVLLGGLVGLLCVTGSPFRCVRRLGDGMTRLLGLALIGASALIVAGCFSAIRTPGLFRYSNDIGMFAVGVTVAAAGLWLVHWSHYLLCRLQLPLTRFFRRVFQYLYRQHAFLGWIALATASAHSLYFLLLIPIGLPKVETGLLAWAILIALIGLGVWLEAVRKRTTLHRNLGLGHLLLALALLIVLFLHV